MKRATLRGAIGIAIAALLAPIVPLHAQEPRNPCVLAELEEVLGAGGIGGTGILAHSGGIGGTGIVGTVTGFGSVCVNGVEVHYDSAVPVTSNGSPADAAQLAVGQVIAVEVAYTQKGLEASSIAILTARAWPFGPGVTRIWLEGLVEREAQADVLTVFGRAIRLSAETSRAGAPAPAPGTRLFLLVRVGPDGTLAAERMAVPRPALPRIIAPPAPAERRIFELPRDIRIEPRFEPRLPGPAPSMPGRTGR